MKKIALVILLLVSGCSTFAKTAKNKKKKVDPNQITSVTVFHSVCFGRCPEYKIQIGSDGTAIYTGMRFSKDTGIFKKTIGKARAKEIIDQVIANRVDTCSNMYENRIPDLPGLTITINYPKKTKNIYNANFGPAFLKEISDNMEVVGRKTAENNTGWKKTGMPKFD